MNLSQLDNYMSFSFVAFCIGFLGLLGLLAGAKRARKMEMRSEKMHSRFMYHGWWVFLLTCLPAFLFLSFWWLFSNVYLEHRALNTIQRIESQEILKQDALLQQKSWKNSTAHQKEDDGLREPLEGQNPNFVQKELLSDQSSLENTSKENTQSSQKDYLLSRDRLLADSSLILSTVRGLLKHPELLRKNIDKNYQMVREEFSKNGYVLPLDGKDYMIAIANQWIKSNNSIKLLGGCISLILSFLGFVIGFLQIRPAQRARNKVERCVRLGLAFSSMIAVLTTIGIVLSLIFETISFFYSVPLSNFFFGTVWDPRFAAAGSQGEIGQFGLLPLLAGTLYIAFVAMLFTVPVGLFSAIYMSEYASRRTRSIVKPLLEVLAGIPTIVYGFFALITVGPFLRDISAALSGGGQGFIMAQSVLTAGLVMGVMLIPFVSSLSDDIITAVPKALRDGSYGLGATRSETVKKVILPAALPGVVGALLLTASRAIGETMIVVLAAGVAARLTLNPFDSMTTITVKIVNQLTGDLQFNSPQTLVAFALGMTLFILTLIMNIYAIYIVRKYREQYE